MKEPESNAILNLTISQSSLSIEFKLVCETLGFHHFSDLLQHRTIRLLNLPGFTQHLIYEYVSFFETQQLGYLIDP